MSFLNVTKATLSTLSPVHLGSGEDFLPTNYVIDDNGWLHSFNEMVIAQALGNKLEQIKGIIHREHGEQMLLSIQRLIHDNRDKLAMLAATSIPVATGFQTLYKSRIGQVAQRENNRRNVINQLPIMRTFINPHTHLPIITGSAIKGAIRTAILNGLAIKAGLRRPQDVTMPKKLANNLLKFDNPTTDPLKLLKISDAEYHNTDQLPATEIVFAVSKRRIAKAGKTAGGPTTYLEAVSGFRSQSFVFDIRFVNNPSQDPNHKLPKDIGELAKICNDYYLPKLNKELLELDEMNYLDGAFVRGLQQLLNGQLGQALQQNKAFLLRLGKHSGAYNKTLDNIRQIYIPQHKKSVSEPPEVRLAATTSSQQAVNLLPFGWVVIELNEISLQELGTFLKQQAKQHNAYQLRDTLINFKQQQTTQQAKLEQQRLDELKEIEEKRLQEEQARLQAEAEKN
ncbi:MAG: type III-A CRISPR-associated RAMP protein Csm5, partial [Pseudomonadales bacterium]|nr:type III-A CRISPR-associated RAMP protein Csm5 [Pseudomonadales bacterium]